MATKFNGVKRGLDKFIEVYQCLLAMMAKQNVVNQREHVPAGS